jgi:hypothetical protein
VIGDEDAVHVTDAGLEGVFEEGGADEVLFEKRVSSDGGEERDMKRKRGEKGREERTETHVVLPLERLPRSSQFINRVSRRLLVVQSILSNRNGTASLEIESLVREVLVLGVELRTEDEVVGLCRDGSGSEGERSGAIGRGGKKGAKKCRKKGRKERTIA